MAEPLKVVHIKRVPPRDYATYYVGRPTIFGNRWSHRPSDHAAYLVPTRAEALSKFAQEQADPVEGETTLDALRREIAERERLTGVKVVQLGCWCAPKACHAHILAAKLAGLPWDALLPADWREQLT